jgi:hypothetical protein
MELGRIRTAIEQAVCVSVQSIQLPGIVEATVRSAAVTSPHLQQVATQLAYHGQCEIRLAAEIEVFLRVSNADLLRSIQRVPFRVEISSDEHGAQAVAVNEDD